MREPICTVSGHTAETTKNHKIRISNDRENHQSYGESDQLSHKGLGQEDLLESRSRFPRSFNNVQVPESTIPVETGWSTGAWEATPGNGRDRSVTYPAIVYLSAIGIAIVVAGISYFLPILAGKVSHLSGLWWDIGGAVVLLVFCIVIFSLLRIAGISDEQADEMGGQR